MVRDGQCLSFMEVVGCGLTVEIRFDFWGVSTSSRQLGLLVGKIK